MEKILDFPFDQDPIVTLKNWLDIAKQKELSNPDAAALATVSSEGLPEVRMVLIKKISDEGLVFYTNLESQKAKSIASNPLASLCFYWKSISKQVRIEGSVKSIENIEADQYFFSRPRDSQVAAWASKQSKELSSREKLDSIVEKIEKDFSGKLILRPPYWSGFLLNPNKIEFWIEGKSRLHNRIEFIKSNSNWGKRLLYP